VSVVVIGLNHRSTPLDLLERVTIGEAALPKALHDLMSRSDISEAVVLSTCNRTEVYAAAERFHGAYQDIRDFLAEIAFLAPEDFSDHLYVKAQNLEETFFAYPTHKETATAPSVPGTSLPSR